MSIFFLQTCLEKHIQQENFQLLKEKVLQNLRSANRKNYVINQPQFSRGVADQSVNFIVSL